MDLVFCQTTSNMTRMPSPPLTLANASACIAANNCEDATPTCMVSALISCCELRSTVLRRPFAQLVKATHWFVFEV